jgi:hypothetical protein
MMIRTRLMASSRAFLSSVGLALLTLTTSRLWLGVGGMGNMERGGGVAVESDGESAARAGLVPLAAFLPRAMFDVIVMGREERKGEQREGRERGEETGERRTCDLAKLNLQSKTVSPVPFPSSNQFAPLSGHTRPCAHLVPSSRVIARLLWEPH